MITKKWLAFACTGLLAVGVAACGGDDDDNGNASASNGNGDTPSGLSGTIRIDGSSTVGPLTEAVAERFNEENPDVDITVGQSGTGGGFEKFCAGETAINDASAQIAPEEEQACEQGGVEWEEVTVANDALTVVLNPENPVTCLTTDQLSQLWSPDGAVASWGEVDDLDAEFEEEVQRFGPGTDSGTFEYFTEAALGTEAEQTRDYNNVGEDDNQTVVGVQGSPGGIGYFGYSYFIENEEGVKAAEIENEAGECVAPSDETVQGGDYNPLGRGLFIYPSAEALQDEAVQAFIGYYIDNVSEIAPEVGFIGLTDEQLAEAQEKVDSLASGGGGGDQS